MYLIHIFPELHPPPFLLLITSGEHQTTQVFIRRQTILVGSPNFAFFAEKPELISALIVTRVDLNRPYQWFLLVRVIQTPVGLASKLGDAFNSSS